MKLNIIPFLVVILLSGCATHQAPVQDNNVQIEQGAELPSQHMSSGTSVEQESAESLKLKSDLLAFEKENLLDEKLRFEKERYQLLKELKQRDSLLALQEADIANRKFQLELREQVVDDKLAQLETKELALSQTISSSSQSSTIQNQQVQTKSSEPEAQPKPRRSSGFNKNASDLKKYRYIQFVASSGGKTYYQYAYLGEVIAEQVPGRDIYRYKIRGKFDDGQVRDIIATLKEEGFHGAFEVK